MSSVLGSSKPDSGFERTRKQGASGGKRCLQAAAVRWHWRRWMAERQVRHKELGFSWRWTGSRTPTCFHCDNAVRSRQRALETTTTFEVQKWFLWHVKTVQNQRNRVKINGYRFSPPFFLLGTSWYFLSKVKVVYHSPNYVEAEVIDTRGFPRTRIWCYIYCGGSGPLHIGYYEQLKLSIVYLCQIWILEGSQDWHL